MINKNILECYISEVLKEEVLEEDWKRSLLTYSLPLISFVQPISSVAAKVIKNNTQNVAANTKTNNPGANKFNLKLEDILVKEGESPFKSRGFQTIDDQLCYNNFPLPDNHESWSDEEMSSFIVLTNYFKTILGEKNSKEIQNITLPNQTIDNNKKVDDKANNKKVDDEANNEKEISRLEKVIKNIKKELKNYNLKPEIVGTFQILYDDLLENQDDDDEKINDDQSQITINDVIEHEMIGENGEIIKFEDNTIKHIALYRLNTHKLVNEKVMLCVKLGKYDEVKKIYEIAKDPNNFGKKITSLFGNI